MVILLLRHSMRRTNYA